MSDRMEFKRAGSPIDNVIEGTFTGYLSAFGVEDADRDIVQAGAFRETLARHAKNGTMPALLWQHLGVEPIGVWESLTEDRRGLLAKGRLSLGVRRADEAYRLLQDGALALSIGYRVAKATRRPGGGRNLLSLDLVEGSVVSVAANPAAKVIEVRGLALTVRELERGIRDQLGLSHRQARRLVSGGIKATSVVRDERLLEIAADVRRKETFYERTEQRNRNGR